jgi:hypothetical protein
VGVTLGAVQYLRSGGELSAELPDTPWRIFAAVVALEAYLNSRSCEKRHLIMLEKARVFWAQHLH